MINKSLVSAEVVIFVFQFVVVVVVVVVNTRSNCYKRMLFRRSVE